MHSFVYFCCVMTLLSSSLVLRAIHIAISPSFRRNDFSTSFVVVISSSQLYLITSVEQPKDAWDALRNHFERTLANKLMLKKQYFQTEMKEGTSVEAHLKGTKELTDKLEAIGAPISEEDQVITLQVYHKVTPLW